MSSKKSFHAPDGDVRLTVNMKSELHQKLRIASAMTRVTMGQLVEQLIKERLDEMLKAGIRPIP